MKIREKRLVLKKKEIICHHDNAPVYKTTLVMRKLRNYGCDSLSLNSLDLASLDFNLIQNVKKYVRAKWLVFNEEIERAVNEHSHSFLDF